MIQGVSFCFGDADDGRNNGAAGCVTATLCAISPCCASLQQSLEWQKFVCCKEPIHVFDWEPICTSSREHVVRLAQKIAGGKFERPNGENIQWFFDELAKYRALAI